MQTIHKYALNDDGQLNKLMLTKNAKVIKADIQYGTICIWVLLDLNDNKVARYFRIYGTGNNISENIDRLGHIDSFQVDDIVYHVFEYIV